MTREEKKWECFSEDMRKAVQDRIKSNTGKNISEKEFFAFLIARKASEELLIFSVLEQYREKRSEKKPAFSNPLKKLEILQSISTLLNTSEANFTSKKSIDSLAKALLLQAEKKDTPKSSSQQGKPLSSNHNAWFEAEKETLQKADKCIDALYADLLKTIIGQLSDCKLKDFENGENMANCFMTVSNNIFNAISNLEVNGFKTPIEVKPKTNKCFPCSIL